ncbi:hypothetical protein [uncultured Jannaschia sp.]|uniref:hypothetical protein n=1 Tax=uncultured Jannaschia sp. TaxID=293347 RepID=UPI00260D06C2|nr:hypothetical protein [uncultured Jannaschia sp.]
MRLPRPLLVSVLTGLMVMGSMLWLGLFITNSYRDLQLRALADAGGNYVDGLLAPMVLTAAAGGDAATDPADLGERLTDLSRSLPQGETLGVLRAWSPDGQLVFGSLEGDTAGTHDVDEIIEVAEGGIMWELVLDEEEAEGAPIAAPFLEIYVPIRDEVSGHTIAVGEVYRDATALVRERHRVEAAVWGGIGLATLGLLLVLGLTARQSAKLRANLHRERVVTAQNARLRAEAENARTEVTLANEMVLNVVGAELHDGPIQTLALGALLSGTDQRPLPDGTSALGLIGSALRQLRSISDGLILPELADLTVTEIVKVAARRHQDSTGRSVALDLKLPSEALDTPRRTCLFRVVQEGLRNAQRHADGDGQEIRCWTENDAIRIVIRNDVDPSRAPAKSPGGGLGLRGMRRRLDVFGGTLDFDVENGRATLDATLPLGASRRI